MFSRLVSVAPMMGWTDRHARYFLRQVSRHSLLYTEMVNTGALLHNRQKVGSQRRLLAHHSTEHPLAIQLGGNDPADLAQCATMAEDAGFDEVNLNVGCPSDRVSTGNFGACLMAQPQQVADCVSAMKAVVSVPVSVKCRIGIDDMEDYPSLKDFINCVAQGGCDTFIVHARKAWLKGLSPKQNREVPPLKYDYVYRLKRDFPRLNIIINGGITTLAAASGHMAHVDGVMIGREAYHNPYILARVDRELYRDDRAEPATREAIVEQMCEYIDRETANGTTLHAITRHMLGLFHGCPGARSWRRHLSENAHHEAAGSSVVKAALARIKQPVTASRFYSSRGRGSCKQS